MSLPSTPRTPPHQGRLLDLTGFASDTQLNQSTPSSSPILHRALLSIPRSRSAASTSPKIPSTSPPESPVLAQVDATPLDFTPIDWEAHREQQIHLLLGRLEDAETLRQNTADWQAKCLKLDLPFSEADDARLMTRVTEWITQIRQELLELQGNMVNEDQQSVAEQAHEVPAAEVTGLASVPVQGLIDEPASDSPESQLSTMETESIDELATIPGSAASTTPSTPLTNPVATPVASLVLEPSSPAVDFEALELDARFKAAQWRSRQWSRYMSLKDAQRASNTMVNNRKSRLECQQELFNISLRRLNKFEQQQEELAPLTGLLGEGFWTERETCRATLIQKLAEEMRDAGKQMEDCLRGRQEDLDKNAADTKAAEEFLQQVGATAVDDELHLPEVIPDHLLDFGVEEEEGEGLAAADEPMMTEVTLEVAVALPMIEEQHIAIYSPVRLERAGRVVLGKRRRDDDDEGFDDHNDGQNVGVHC